MSQSLLALTLTLICWAAGAQEIDCKYPGIKGLVLRAEFVRKR
jgi:uncharacterized Zn ribbon protein